jgi:NADH-quinone oxidoreductase subunit N
VLGSALSLVYDLRVIAAVWLRSPSEAVAVRARPAMAGGSEEADAAPAAVAPADGPLGRRLRQPEVIFVALVCTVATVALGIYPDPLLDLARDAGAALPGLV